MSDGNTIEEAIVHGIDAIRAGIAAMRAEGHPIPAPTLTVGEHLKYSWSGR